MDSSRRCWAFFGKRLPCCAGTAATKTLDASTANLIIFFTEAIFQCNSSTRSIQQRCSLLHTYTAVTNMLTPRLQIRAKRNGAIIVLTWHLRSIVAVTLRRKPLASWLLVYPTSDSRVVLLSSRKWRQMRRRRGESRHLMSRICPPHFACSVQS